MSWPGKRRLLPRSPAQVQRDITSDWRDRMARNGFRQSRKTPSGRASQLHGWTHRQPLQLHGPIYMCDAALCVSNGGIGSAVKGLLANDFDVAVAGGGIDRDMGAPTFVKFCKIGALSATGTRPFARSRRLRYGEGAAIFILKRLADAEQNGTRCTPCLRGIGGASDGKGKGITAPNPIGQKLCVERAWKKCRTVACNRDFHGRARHIRLAWAML